MFALRAWIRGTDRPRRPLSRRQRTSLCLAVEGLESRRLLHGGGPPTLIPLPDELLSPRLLLQPYRPGDADQVFAAIDESRAHLRLWMTWVDDHVSVDNSQDWCTRCAANWLLRAELTVGGWAGLCDRGRAPARRLGLRLPRGAASGVALRRAQ